MNYIDLNIRTNDSEQSEIFIAQLSDWPFDSFDDQEGVLHAYIRETDFAACREEVENLLQESGASFGTELIADRNWNEVWESNFEPIEVEGRCSIRAPFHVPRPDLPFDIVIMPKMAFGTGHHATTQLMVEEILDHAAGRTLRVGYGQRNRDTVDPRGKKRRCTDGRDRHRPVGLCEQP